MVRLRSPRVVRQAHHNGSTMLTVNPERRVVRLRSPRGVEG